MVQEYIEIRMSTLSGGECQRIKLASELHKRGSIYVMDEPTTGLHLSDIDRLLTIMNRLVDGGNAAVVIEHHLDVIRHADWIIDWGQKAARRAAWSSSRGHRENSSKPRTR